MADTAVEALILPVGAQRLKAIEEERRQLVLQRPQPEQPQFSQGCAETNRLKFGERPTNRRRIIRLPHLPSLHPGVRLGPYEILSALGAGGMGEVYRARDTKLNREVALKVLPDAFTRDPDRLARFRREAQVLASLNHPHIGAIYGFEDSGETHALVLELVEGLTLAEKLAELSRVKSQVSGLPLDEALSIARQIAEALEAAHEQGIIHRDLKPSNIKITPDGVVKVLDFGLAKLAHPEAVAGAANVTASPTITSPAMMTGVGVLLGTAAYMSPEQAKGREADKRSDVWAFGCVLYEMLTGRRAFDAEDVSETLAAVLLKEPDWTALPATTAGTIKLVLRRCLQKDRKRRTRDIGDVLLALEDALENTASQVTVAVAKPRWRRSLSLAGFALLAVALLSAGAWRLSRVTSPSPVTRFMIALPEGKTLASAARQNLAISPDGTQIVYASDGRLFSRALGDFEARALAGTETALRSLGPESVDSPAFSPDGRSVVFFSSTDRALKRVGLEGGAPVTLCPADPPSGLTWDASGILFGQGAKGIFRCPTAGGESQQLVKVGDGEGAYGPQFLPGTDLLLFTISAMRDGTERWEKANVVIESLSSGERTTLIRGGSDARYLRSGHLVYGLSGTILAAPFDPRAPSEIGEAVPVVQGVQRTVSGATGVVHFVTSDGGTLVYLPGPASGPTGERIIAAADRAGTVERLSPPSGPYVHVRASRDGKFLAIGSDDSREAIVSIFPLDGTSAVRRLMFEGKNRFPIWSSDGVRVAFQSDLEGDLGIFTRRADGTGTIARLTQPAKGEAHAPESWSPDGKTLLFTVQEGKTFSLWNLSIESGKAAPLGDVRSTEPIDPVFAPDGRWIAYRVRIGNLFSDSNNGVYVQPFPPTGARYQAPRVSGDFHPVWAPDGDSLVYVPSANSGRLAIVRVMKDHAVTFGIPMTMPAVVTGGVLSAGRRAYDVLPDGRFIGLVAPGDVPSTVGSARQIRVVLNWFEELKRLVPVN
jgi:serine/threonine-protein kinase